MEEKEYISKLKLKEWAEEDRPREKLLLKGKSALSDAELLAIIIGSGSTEKTVVELSRDILTGSENNLNALGQLSVNDLMKFKGIGEAKAISIIAALELGRRRGLSRALDKKIFRLSSDAYQLLAPVLADLDHEEFWVVYLKQSNEIIKMERLSSGGMTGTVADVRMILKCALECKAVGIILAHNHPSGSLKPSASDKAMTDRIKKAASIMDIAVLDHIIVSHKGYFSFSDQSLL